MISEDPQLPYTDLSPKLDYSKQHYQLASVAHRSNDASRQSTFDVTIQSGISGIAMPREQHPEIRQTGKKSKLQQRKFSLPSRHGEYRPAKGQLHPRQHLSVSPRQGDHRSYRKLHHYTPGLSDHQQQQLDATVITSTAKSLAKQLSKQTNKVTHSNDQ